MADANVTPRTNLTNSGNSQATADSVSAAAAGFGHMMVLFQSVGELLNTRPELAQSLAAVGASMADSLENQMLNAEDVIERQLKGGAA